MLLTGTVSAMSVATTEDAWAVLSAPPAGLEDGTLGFLNIAALKHGFAMLDRLGGIKVGFLNNTLPVMYTSLASGTAFIVPACVLCVCVP